MGTGTAPAYPPEPKAAASFQEVNTAHGFAFQMKGSIKSGPQVVKVTNSSDQPHFVEIDKPPVPLTEAQLMQILALPPNATPPAGLPSVQQIVMGERPTWRPSPRGPRPRRPST